MSEVFDFGIAGGGLAGSSLAILMARKGYSVVLFEKENYPCHKVCGEYISMESYPFLQRLGLPLESLEIPRISKLLVSSPQGNVLRSVLEPGGFGLSRYYLDAALQQRSIESGVQWITEKVLKVETTVEIP